MKRNLLTGIILLAIVLLAVGGWWWIESAGADLKEREAARKLRIEEKVRAYRDETERMVREAKEAKRGNPRDR